MALLGLDNAFQNFGKQIGGRLLPPSKFDPAAILARVIGVDRPNPKDWKPERPGSLDVLSAMRGRGDPLLSFNWYCELPILGSKTTLGWEFIEEATLPFVEFEQQSNYRAGKMHHYAGHSSLGSLSLKMYENSGGLASYYMQYWQGTMMDTSTGKYFHPADYQKPIKFTIFDVTKLSAMFLTYEKCWPMRGDAFSLVSGSSERIAPTWEFSTDDVIVQFGKYERKDIPAVMSNVTKAGSTPKATQILKDAASLLTDKLPFSFP